MNTRFKHLRLTALLLGLGAAPWLNAHASSLAAAGKQIAAHGIGTVPACATCHGVKGTGNPQANFPRLAGMGADYLAEQLTDYAAGTRNNPIMTPFAKQLTPAQIHEVADYYAQLPSPKVKSLPPAITPEDKMAKELLTQGDWSRTLPSCFACHGANAVGVPPSFPALVGQSATYTAEQLTAWQQDHRAAGAGGLMAAIAKRLKPEEITAIANYLAKVPVH